MNAYLKIALISAAIYAGCLLLAFAVIAVTAGVTNKMSAGQMGPVVAFLAIAGLVIFAAGTFVVQRASASILAGQGAPWIMTVLFVMGGLVTVIALGFLALIVLNR